MEEEATVEDIVNNIKIVRNRCQRLMVKINKSQSASHVKRLNAMVQAFESYMQLLNNLTVDLAAAALKKHGM